VIELNALLSPFLTRTLSQEQLDQIQRYLDLLLKWNAKISLTSVLDPKEIVRRHFGESLFAGERLLVGGASTLIDLGSGAGFPGLPIKILAPALQVTLIESQQKKVAFLREVIRGLALSGVSVEARRAEECPLRSQIVTMRAVDKFEAALQVAASLVEAKGKLALLVSATQSLRVFKLLPNFSWDRSHAIPCSRERILLVGAPLPNLP
jgi:16S rRNA (guanine527-N7)-methyltransferase